MRISLSAASLLAGLLTLSALSVAQAEEIPGQVLDALQAAPWKGPTCRLETGLPLRMLRAVQSGGGLGRFARHFLYRLPECAGSGSLAASRGFGARDFASAGGGSGRRLDAPAARPLGRQRYGGGWGPLPGQRGWALAGRDSCSAQFELGWRLVPTALLPDSGHWRAQPLRRRRAAQFSVGFVMDDVDLSGMGTTGLLFDIDQVEVFKGPSQPFLAPMPWPG